jgi:hypothetical protein
MQSYFFKCGHMFFPIFYLVAAWFHTSVAAALIRTKYVTTNTHRMLRMYLTTHLIHITRQGVLCNPSNILKTVHTIYIYVLISLICLLIYLLFMKGKIVNSVIKYYFRNP